MKINASTNDKNIIQESQKKEVERKKVEQAKVSEQKREAAKAEFEQKQAQKIDVEKYLKDILNITDTFNRRLKFSINRELNEVVVKVVDKNTDKVIREIPPEELQRLHIRLKEAIGQLFDERI